MEKQVMSPAMKGMLISLALIVIQVAIILTGQEANKSLGSISIAVLIGGIIWACLSFSKQKDGNVTFGDVFSHGFKTSALVAALFGLWTALSLTIIFPEVFEHMMEIQRVEMLKKGMSDDQVENAMKMAHKMGIPMGTIIIVIMDLVLGAVGALIGAAIAKKNPNPVFPEQLGN